MIPVMAPPPHFGEVTGGRTPLTGRALAVGTADRRAGQSAVKDALTELARFYRLELD